jgi:hypothetical protein
LNRIRKGTTTLPTATATNAAFTPTSVDQWNGETLTLTSSSFMTNHYQLKFEFICYGGNNVYLDDINISGVDTLGNFIELHESPVGINLYPNPTNRSSILEIATDSHRKTQVRLYNAAGQIIQQNFTGYLTVGTHQIEITPPSSGFYFVEIVSGNQCIRKKLIVQ